jgi:hypothetical protein
VLFIIGTWGKTRPVDKRFTLDCMDTDTEVDTEDSELADSDSGDPARLIFLRLRGRPFNFGAEK